MLGQLGCQGQHGEQRLRRAAKPTNLRDGSSLSCSCIIHAFSSSVPLPRLCQVKQMNARLHKICCCIGCGFGSLLPCCSQQALLSLQAWGEEQHGGEKLPQVLLRLGANEPASPPHNKRKQQFILTNGEGLQRGRPLLSKLVYHTEAYTLEQRGEGTTVKWYLHHSRRETSSSPEEPG